MAEDPPRTNDAPKLPFRRPQVTDWTQPIPITPGTGGFLILRKLPPPQGADGTSWHVAVFVGLRAGSFQWTLPTNDDGTITLTDWAVVDIEKGFAISNGERLWQVMGGDDPDDPIVKTDGKPVIVHGHP